jgi:fructose-1,6-bisphosphatase/inositol monophosphatase family enzyme
MNVKILQPLLCALGERVAERVLKTIREQAVEQRTAIHARANSDVIYSIDAEVDGLIVEMFEQEAEALGGVVLVAEGIGETEVTIYPKGLREDEAALRVICDPIDGTRGIMYDKRSAFFLAGVAPNKGAATHLSDIELAVMVEIPTSRMHVADTLWAVRGAGAQGERRNVQTGERQPLQLSPSRAPSIAGGFIQVSRFFDPGKEALAALEERLIAKLFPDLQDGEIACFEDQYLSSAGQLYELITGKDRFVAELRASLYRMRRRQGKRIGHVCHPYDLAAHLIGSEAGVILTGADGQPLDAPLNTSAAVDWIGFANKKIHQEVASVLQELISEWDG